jgi:hypothetical protein
MNPQMGQRKQSRSWLIAGIISGAVMIVGIVIFVVASQPTDNAASPLGLLGLGFLLMLVGFPAFAISLAGGAIRVVRRQGWTSKLLAGFMVILAIPLLLYGLLLFLSVAGIIHVI